MLLDRVKRRAKSFDMTLQDVAEKTGISPNTIYSWKHKTPRSDKLQQVAEVLKTTTDYLNGTTDDPSIPSNEEKAKRVDLADDEVILSYDGKPASKHEMEIIKMILKGDE